MATPTSPSTREEALRARSPEPAGTARRSAARGQGPLRHGRRPNHGRLHDPSRQRPKPDRPAVARLEAAGAIVVGKTNMHEFAWGVTSQNPHWGTVANPRLPGHVAGGSSGGTAAALAHHQATIGLGTDTGGSIRIPAACCGVVGFKPALGARPVRRLPARALVRHRRPDGADRGRRRSRRSRADRPAHPGAHRIGRACRRPRADRRRRPPPGPGCPAGRHGPTGAGFRT